MIKIGIIGNGAWGTTILLLISENISKNPIFEQEVWMFTRDEPVNGQSLIDIINSKKHNPIYLPNVELPENSRATAKKEDIEECDVILFCLPVTFIQNLEFRFKEDALLINLSKGFFVNDTDLLTPCEFIRKKYNRDTLCLMGSNIAEEVASGEISECVIGFTDPCKFNLLRNIFENSFFRVRFIPYNKGIEITGATKNIISLGFGILQGLNYGSNTKSMLFRVGLLETKRLCETLGGSFPLLESCCISDLLTSCLNGRNYKLGIEIGSSELKLTNEKTGILASKKVVAALDSSKDHISANNKKIHSLTNLDELNPVDTTLDIIPKSNLENIYDLEMQERNQRVDLIENSTLEGPISARKLNHWINCNSLPKEDFSLFIKIYEILYEKHSCMDLIQVLSDYPLSE